MHFKKSIAIATGLCLASVASPATAGDPVKISSGQSVKGMTNVVIGAFNVGFLFESIDDTAAEGGLIGAFSGPTHAKSVLEGVTPAMMQQITDAAYQNFVAQLTSRGYLLSEPSSLFNNARMAKVKPLSSPFEASVSLGKDSRGKTHFYKPSDLPVQFMLPGDLTADDTNLNMATTGAGVAGKVTKVPGLGMLGAFGGLAKMGKSMAGAGTQVALATYAREQNVSVIDVVYLVDFSDAKRKGFFSLGGMNVTGGMSIVGNYSKVQIVAPGGQTSIVLKEPIGVEGDFATKSDTTGGFNKATGAAASVIGAFAGIKGGKSAKYAFTVKPDAYQTGATKATMLANTRVVEAIASLK